MAFQFTPRAPGAIRQAIAILNEHYRAPGRAYSQTIAIAHGLKCLKRKTFDDNRAMRTRRNVIIYGPRGSCKSFMTKKFLSELAGCVDAAEIATHGWPTAESRPTMISIGSGTSWERLRGTVGQDGALLAPILQRADWIYASELMSFLGHNPVDRAKRIEDFNGAFEEGHINVTLVKMANMDIKKRREMANKILPNAGYSYDPENCSLQYDCTATFMGSCRFLPNKLFQELELTGYWSRNSVGEWRPTKSQAKEYADDKFGPEMDASAVAHVRAKFIDLWNTKFVHANAPPRAMVLECVRWFNGELIRIEEDLGIPFNTTFSSRDDTDMAQLITASCIDRISGSRKIGDRSDVQSLDYLPEDATAARDWAKDRIDHIRNSYESEASEAEAEKADKSAAALISFLKESAEFGHEEEIATVVSKLFVDYFRKAGLGSESSARRSIRALKKGGAISPIRDSPGTYSVDDSIIARLHAESKTRARMVDAGPPPIPT